MVSKLNKRLSALGDIAPELNAAADEVNQTIKMVEKTLVDELKLGVSARSNPISVDRQRVTDKYTDLTVDEEVTRYLAFGRVSGSYCIHIVEATDRQGANRGHFDQEVDSTSIPWSRCDRELRLMAFEQLPTLLDRILARAKTILEAARKTQKAVREMTADDQP
ncbi:MAG: hypothetical protein ACLQIB_57585 [Isosphaeraceae bacterium]